MKIRGTARNPDPKPNTAAIILVKQGGVNALFRALGGGVVEGLCAKSRAKITIQGSNINIIYGNSCVPGTFRLLLDYLSDSM